MLFNIHTLKWDEDILKELNIPLCMLPEVRPSSCVYGETASTYFGGPIPIAGAAGDQQAALFGQGCFTRGQAKNTYGTGCFTLMNVGGAPVRSRAGLVTTVGWSLNGETTYALEGSVFNAGSAIQWLRDELQVISTSHECDILAESVPDSGGIYLVPAFTGLGAPYWDMYARGCVVGITRGTTKAHFARAVLEFCADPKRLGAKTLFATHYHELTELEGVLPGVKNYSISIKKRGDELIFLRKIVPGGADRSYGIEVAKLAGLPNEVVRRANVILKELEQGGAYQAKPREETEQVSLDAIGEAEVLAAIRRAQPDTMSPIEAMQLLYELKQKLS